ncbi:MAG: CHAP domain-containing protein, partial [Candidatus Saccharibacteria bacterium]
ARASAGNRYAPGNCTWYAYERRMELGRPIGSFWGNGGSWGYSAAAAGFAVDHSPESGAILVEVGSPGHVGVVESVRPGDSITITEMNNQAYGGYGRVNSRTISWGAALVYTYIH